MRTTITAGRAARAMRTRTRGALLLLALVSLLCAILAGLSFVLLGRADDLNRRQALALASGGSLVQRMHDVARAAVGGDADAFARLRASRERFQAGLASLRDHAAIAGRSPDERLMIEAEQSWETLRAGIDRILADQETLQAMQARIQAAEVLFPQIAEVMERLATRLAETGAPPERILQAARQPLRLDRMRTALNRIRDGGLAATRAIDDYRTGAEEYNATLRALNTPGRPADQAVLEEALSLSSTLDAATSDLMPWARAALPAIDTLPDLRNAGDRLETALAALAAAYRDAPRLFHLGSLPVGTAVVPLLAAIALIGLLLLALLTLRESRHREELSQAQIDRDERAILRLLDEMGNLADGDLTVEATVTEDKTGAIADAINYAVEALRILVTTINETAIQVNRAAQVSRGISLRLAGASRVQAQRITHASGAIASLTTQIDEVARNAGESAEVASRAVEVAGRGAMAVRDTIVGMDAIRGQIQDTAKRMKRLGDSSQEIGEIVELIDDIADQTNILALNAAMQAAMAGEAGRGFAVVADEVQRLAERSRNATRQIEGLVRAIQADTNEAIGSMETSTANVVGGARLAERAGDALREIENVSTYIAELTRRIADSAERQSRQSAEINETVQAIRAITEENNDGTRRAAESVEELANLAVELQRSVAGFRLPT